MTSLKAPATAAHRRAAEYWQANRNALALTQPDLDLGDDALSDLTWLFARDGSLTARDKLGQWWAGCSLPRRAGRAMLRKLDMRGVVACLLAPTHAGQVAAALEQIQPQQAVIIIQPDLAEARVMLGCADFADDLRRHRLWLAVGAEWATTLRQLFDNQPGLPTPSQFIRLPVTAEEVATPLIRTAETLFNEVNAARAERMNRLSHRPGDRLVLLAPSQFRLWDDAGNALIASIGLAAGVVHIDPDDPAQSAPLPLASAAADGCAAMVVPNRFRSDLPSVLPDGVRIVTWLTQPRLAPYDAQRPGDVILLADEDWLPLAQSAGWTAEAVAVGHWPTTELPPSPEPALALIADTVSLDTPTGELELSSHHVLWEMIRADLLADPFAIRGDAVGFIDRRRAKLGVSEEGFNRDLFIARLIVPAYQQAVASRLIRAGLPLRIYGRGWDRLSPEFVARHHGTIVTREEFRAAVASASALVYPLPLRQRHPIHAHGRPVVGPALREAELISDARRALTLRAEQRSQSEPLLDAIRELLSRPG